MRRVTHWSFTDSTERDAEATVQDGDVCSLLDGSFFVRSGGVWSAVGVGGGEAYSPGFFDFSSAVFGCHFDEESAGTWAAEVGNDLAYAAGNTPIVTSGPRPVTTFRSGFLEGTHQANLVIPGDVTLMVAYRQAGGSVAGGQSIASFGGASSNTGNNQFALEWLSSRLQGFWQYNSGTIQTVQWNSQTSPNQVAIGYSWHVITLRRDQIAGEAVISFDDYHSEPIAFANDPTGGSAAYMSIGRYPNGTSPLLNAQIAGVGVWNSYLNDEQVGVQVSRILTGAAKL